MKGIAVRQDRREKTGTDIPIVTAGTMSREPISAI